MFAMMFYPIFIGAKADRFNNYQVLLAVLPLTIWLYLRAYDEPNVRAGIALGLSAAAAMLTIYSAAFGSDRHRTCRDDTSRPAEILYSSGAFRGDGHRPLGAVAPYRLGFFHNDFSSLRWAESFVDQGVAPRPRPRSISGSISG